MDETYRNQVALHSRKVIESGRIKVEYISTKKKNVADGLTNNLSSKLFSWRLESMNADEAEDKSWKNRLCWICKSFPFPSLIVDKRTISNSCQGVVVLFSTCMYNNIKASLLLGNPQLRAMMVSVCHVMLYLSCPLEVGSALEYVDRQRLTIRI